MDGSETFLYYASKFNLKMDVQEKLELIKQNTEEILTEEDLLNLLKTKKKISAYHGTAPTGPYHMAYLVPIGKMVELEKAGIKVKFLIANIHAALDDLKAPWEQIDKRGEYYKKCIELAFPWQTKPEFIFGSDFQLEKKYMLDVLKVSTLSTVKRATRAASEVTRMKNPKVSELIYPIMQAMDEVGLDVDIQLGGIDQRHILAFAREYLPKIGHKRRVEIMTPLIASLKGPGTKMSASIPMSHIKVYDSEVQIKAKLKGAYCLEGDTLENPVLQLCQFIIFPAKGKLKIERPAKFGGNIEFKSYKELETVFVDKQLHPGDLKPAVAAQLIDIFKKARDYFDKNKDMLKELGQEFLP